MKTFIKICLLIFVLAISLWPVPAHAQGLSCEKFIAGGTYTLEQGEILKGSLCLFGGTAKLMKGSVVERDVFLVGGKLSADGKIKGDLIAAGGLVTLSQTTDIYGNVIVLGAQIIGQDEANILGEIKEFNRGYVPDVIPSSNWYPNFSFLNPTWSIVTLPLRSLLWAAAAILVVLLFPNGLTRIGRTVGSQPVQSGAVGCGSLFLISILLIGFAVTIICSPLSLIGLFALLLFWFIGIIGLGTEVGRKISLQAKSDWALAVWAGIGTFLVTLVLNGIELAVPCVGTIIKLIGGSIGFGAVLLTRVGSQLYPPSATAKSPANPPAPLIPSQPQMVSPELEVTPAEPQVVPTESPSIPPEMDSTSSEMAPSSSEPPVSPPISLPVSPAPPLETEEPPPLPDESN